MAKQKEDNQEANEEKTVETREERFIRIATYRTNLVLTAFRVLGNCANRQTYDYSVEDIEKIKNTIQEALDSTMSKFQQTAKTQAKFVLK